MIARRRADPSPDLADDRARALALTPVSRETAERLDRFVALLLQWQQTTNLIAPATVPHLWTRHVADSLQLLDLAPDARIWVDIGSGGGFPGLVVACALAETPGATIHLVESNAKKAAFLRAAAAATGARAAIHAVRMEKFVETFSGKADIVTARAVASLNLLLEESVRLLDTGACALFLKGQDVEAEVVEASKYWNFKVNLVPSRTEPAARIAVIRGAERRPRRA